MLTEQQVRDAMKQGAGVKDPQAIGINELFSAFGLDSMDLFNLLVELEVLTGIKVPDESVGKLNTIKAILDYYNARG